MNSENFFSKSKSIGDSLNERERTVVHELLEAKSRNATRIEFETQQQASNAETGSAAAATPVEAAPAAKIDSNSTKQQKQKSEHQQKKPHHRIQYHAGVSTEFSRINSLHRFSANISWSQRLYLVVCHQLSVKPRKYVLNALNGTSISLNNKISSSNEALAIAVALTDCNVITSVTISDNKLSSKALIYIAYAVWQNYHIKSFTLSGNQFSDECLQVIIQLIIEARHLTDVSLRNNEIRDAQGECIAELLLGTSTINQLDLSFNQLGDSAAKYIGPALAENDSIRHLNLNWNCFRATGGRLLMKSLNENIALRDLTLKMNGLGMEGAGYVAKCLAKNETLLSIDLSNNRINDFGFELLAKMVARNEILKEIRLGNNPVTTAGVFSVLQALHRNDNSALRILNFEGIYIDTRSKGLMEDIKAEKNQEIYFEMHGTITNGTESKRKEMIRGIIDHESPLEILRFYIEKTGSRLVDIFNVLDSEKKNSVTKSELIRGLNKLNVTLTLDQVDILFDELDFDKSGDIDFGELMAGDKEARKALRQKGKFKAAAVNMDETPEFADI